MASWDRGINTPCSTGTVGNSSWARRVMVETSVQLARLPPSARGKMERTYGQDIMLPNHPDIRTHTIILHSCSPPKTTPGIYSQNKIATMEDAALSMRRTRHRSGR